MWVPMELYKTLGYNKNVCGGRVTIIGTRLEPFFIYDYMRSSNLTKEEAMLDFNLTDEQMEDIINVCELTNKLLGEEEN